MNRIARGVVFIVAVAVLCIFVQPQISVAETYELLKELNLSNGRYTETINTQYSATGEELEGFKGVELAVRNGTVNSKFRVACAEIFLDGEEIFSENDFNSSYIFSTQTVPYGEEQAEVLLEVRVSGTWKSSLNVKVTGIYEEVADSTDPPTVTVYYLDEDGDGVGGFISIESEYPLFYPWVLIGNDIDDTNPFIQ